MNGDGNETETENESESKTGRRGAAQGTSMEGNYALWLSATKYVYRSYGVPTRVLTATHATLAWLRGTELRAAARDCWQ